MGILQTASKSKPMKKYLASLTVVFMTAIVYGQRGFGFDLGFSTSKAPMVAVKYYLGKNAASVGASYQIFNDALGKKEEEIVSGGDVAIGDGHYFYSIDIGYTRVLSEKVSLSGEVSFAKKSHYQNLSKNDFSQYHRILDTDSEVGVGGFVIYNFSEVFGLFGGYNSVRQATVGIELRIVKEKKRGY